MSDAEVAAAKAAEEAAKAGEKGKEKDAKGFDAETSFKGLSEKVDKVLEGLVAKGKKEDAFDPEALLRELTKEDERRPARRGEEEKGAPKLEDMTPGQFANFVLSTVKEHLVSPLEAKVEGLRVRAEVAECRAKYDDFMEYRDEIFKLAMRKPELALEEAYLQVTGQSTVKSKREAKEKEEKEAKDKADKSKADEERSSRRQPFTGERGGPSREASKVSPNSLEEAATIALKDVLGQEK